MGKRPIYFIILLVMLSVNFAFANPSIKMVAPDTVSGVAGTQFTMDIVVGDPNPVNNLVGVSFFIAWSDTSLIKGLNAVPGSFLGSNPIFLKQIYDDHMEIGISSISGGHSGSGTIVQITFQIKQDVSASQALQFTLSNISAVDAGGNNLTLVPVQNPISVFVQKPVIQASIALIVPDTLVGQQGNSFTVDIDIGNPMPVNNLVGASFFISWDDTALVQANDVVPGSFLGNNPIFLRQIYDDHVEVGISSISGGHSGSGTLAQASFSFKTNATYAHPIHLSLSNLSAVDAGGNTVELLPVANPVEIIIKIAPPAIPILLSPQDGAIDIPLSPTFSWQADSLADFYQFQLALDYSFSNILLDSTCTTSDLSLAPGLLDYSTQYFWRVRATNSSGSSNWSDVWNFTTVPNYPPIVLNPIPDLQLPEDFSSFEVADLDTVFGDNEGDSLVFGAQAFNAGINVSLIGSQLILQSVQNWNGQVQVQVTADDGYSRSVTSDTFVVTVTPVNDPPLAVADSATTTEDTPVTIAVLANDSDIENDPLAVAAVTQGTHGSVVINPDSTVTYTPDSNYNGPDQFSYVASDGNGGLDTADVFVTISPANDPPVVAHPIADVSVSEDFAAFTAADLDTVFSDIDGDSLVYGAVSLGGNVTVQLNGSLLILGSTPNYFGTETIVVSGDDQVNRAVVSDTFVVTVTPVNDPPLAVADSATTTEDTPVTIAVLANDSDIEDDPLSVAAVTQATHGSVVINPDSTVTYTPNANYNGPDQFSYVASDGNGGLDTADVFVSVTATNDPPVVAHPIADVSVSEDFAAFTAADLDTVFSDIDGDSLVYGAVSLGGNVTVQLNGSLLNLGSTPNYFGTETIVVSADDQVDRAVAQDTFLVMVTPVNDPPVIADSLPDFLEFASSDSVQLFIWEYVEDIETPDSLLQYSFSSDTLGIILNYHSNSGLLIISAQPDFGGEANLFIHVEDDSGAVALDTVAIMVNPTAIDPWAGNIPTTYIMQQNYPNPFNPVTQIRFGVPKTGPVKIEIFNILGQRVAVLLNRNMEPGYHVIQFDASHLASGLYIYRMQAGDFLKVRKMLLLK